MDEERKRALKKQVRDQERQTFMNTMPISLLQAHALIEALDARLANEPCDHTLRLTIEWCKQQGLNPEQVADWTRDHGGYCDCEVAANLAEPVGDAGKPRE